jgi:hypothetical protein
MTRNQFLNILTFLMILGNEDVAFVAKLAPEYIVEKYFRYITVAPRDDDSYRWGMHPSLEQIFHSYQEAWSDQLDDMFGLVGLDG